MLVAGIRHRPAPPEPPAGGALGRCPDCGGIVSLHADACPHCGRPKTAPAPASQAQPDEAEMPTYQNVIAIGGALLIVVVFVTFVSERTHAITPPGYRSTTSGS